MRRGVALCGVDFYYRLFGIISLVWNNVVRCGFLLSFVSSTAGTGSSWEDKGQSRVSITHKGEHGDPKVGGAEVSPTAALMELKS